MSVAIAIDQQISHYLGRLNPKQKKAVLTVVKTLAEDQDDQQIIHSIPEQHKKIVRQRVKKYAKNPELLLDWNKAQKSIKLG
jgi:hypothetical protein